MSWLVRWCRHGSAPCGTTVAILSLLVSRDLKVKYADSVLGYFWSVLEPLVMAGVYWFVFTKLMTRQVGEDPYIVFLLCGMLPWQWASAVLRSSMKALSKDSKLVRSTNLPREIWVLRTVGSKFAEFLYALPVLAFFALLTRAELHWWVVFVPLAMLLQTHPAHRRRADARPAGGAVRRRRAADAHRACGCCSTSRRSSTACNDVTESRAGLGLPASCLHPQPARRHLRPLPRRVLPRPVGRLGRRSAIAAVVLGGCAASPGIYVFRRLEGTVLKEI